MSSLPDAIGAGTRLTATATLGGETSEFSGNVTVTIATAVTLMSFEAAPSDGAVDLSWRTGSELQNLGFNLYRGPSATGPWTRLNPTLIPGLGSSPLGQGYTWRDSGLVNGVRYYYRLEDVDTRSVSTFHGPISAVPKAGVGVGFRRQRRRRTRRARCAPRGCGRRTVRRLPRVAAPA